MTDIISVMEKQRAIIQKLRTALVKLGQSEFYSQRKEIIKEALVESEGCGDD